MQWWNRLVNYEEEGWDGDVVREIIEKKEANVVVDLLLITSTKEEWSYRKRLKGKEKVNG